MTYILYRNVVGEHPVRFESSVYKNSFASERAAKAAITRMVKKGVMKLGEYAVSELKNYYDNIDYEYTGVNGFKVRCSTPYCCDPNFERYHSM